MVGSWHGSESDDSSHLERGVDHIYEAFICPLTKQVMHDPVTLENGRTFEREAIEKWFKKCRDSGRPPSCPLTSQELSSSSAADMMSPSIALRNTIEEWRSRNDAAKLDVARQALFLGNDESDVLQALMNVRQICRSIRSSRQGVRNAHQLVRMIIDVLKSNSDRVRYKALQTLRVVVEGDEESKGIVAEGDTVRTLVKFLSHEPSKGKEAAVSLLFELSKSEALCEKIGSVNGALILLVGLTSSSNSVNVSIVEKADRTLENMERSEEVVRQMASCGRLQPLLGKILKGSPETKLSMTTFLGELSLNNDTKVLVAQTVGSSLVDLMRTGDMPQREAALRALNNISSFEGSAKVLISTGILPPLIKDLFYVGPNNLPIRLKEVSATILANIVNTGYDFDKATLVSDKRVENLLYLISNTGPSIQCKLLEVLVGLTTCQKTVVHVVSAIKTSGAIISLVQFVEVRENDDLRLASIKLLHNLSPLMSEELADALRGTAGQLDSLVAIISEKTPISEEQAAAAGLLAELPERDLALTREMLTIGAFEKIVSKVIGIRQGEIKGMRFERNFLEGLVRILSRITFAFSNETRAAVTFCREYDVASLFIHLIQSNGQDTIQMVSAMALENLSLESMNLSHMPDLPPPSCGSIFSCMSKPPVVTGLCKIHNGVCSLRETFCLVEGEAVEKLVALLDHENDKVVEASLAALSSLLEDGLDVEKGVKVLDEADAIRHVLNVLTENRTEKLTRRAVWLVERILRIEDIAREVAEQPNVSASLVDAFQNGDFRTRQIAENALKHIDKIPNFSGIFPNMG